jgi:hypothetical protein
MSPGVRAEDLFVGNGERFKPINFQFRLSLQMFHRAEDSLRSFGMSGFAIFRTATVRDDFHATKLTADSEDFTD